ncbi:MAG: S-layer homology domain-containing protein [Acidobacteria bacterium]|nr:S-layer homology domain-containing protein [Acidobacteriota bacterium]
MKVFIGCTIAVLTVMCWSASGQSLSGGNALLAKGDIAGAQKQFEAALASDPRDPYPRLGLALVNAALGRVREGEQMLESAGALAKTNQAKLEYHVTAIRFHTRAHDTEKWLDKARKHFEDGIRINNKFSPLQYGMAQAYAAANDLSRAQDLFAQVVSLRSQFAAEADREWKKIQKILRASPATRTGAGIAMQDRISRADLCALLARELRIGKAFKDQTAVTITLPSDISGHPRRDDILEVLRWRIRGLEVRPDGKFAPDEPVRRGEFAFVIEDVLIKATGDSTLATRYIGTERSPFTDVPSTYAWFNSIMTATSRGLLEAGVDGKFNPESYVEGADTLLGVRKLATEGGGTK